MTRRLYRVWGWMRKLFCVFCGLHTTSGADWGYAMRGMVDLYCPNCLQIVRRVPLEDCEDQMPVRDILDMIYRG